MDSDKRLSLVYFGSGPLAAESLAFLHTHFNIEIVITKPRAAHHKGTVPVVEFCETHGLPYMTPANKKELTQQLADTNIKSQLGVVIDYGIIIEKAVIDTFPLGIVNSHFSLLPQWRGADPITFAILSGQPETGVSLMLINEAMDEGPLLAQATVEVSTDTTAPTLTNELLTVSNALLAEILPRYVLGEIQPVPQSSSISDSKIPSYSRKLTKNDGLLDWQKPAEQLVREVNAYLEWPKSRTNIGPIEAIITAAHATSAIHTTPGSVEISDSSALRIGTSSGFFCIDRLKPTGKKEMTAAEFLRGYGSRLA